MIYYCLYLPNFTKALSFKIGMGQNLKHFYKENIIFLYLMNEVYGITIKENVTWHSNGKGNES